MVLEGQDGYQTVRLVLLINVIYLYMGWLHIWTGRGFEPVRRRFPETPPKVRTIHGATSGGPNSELIKALKKFAPPPLIWTGIVH